MDSGSYYIGADLKFQITLEARGFDQDNDEYRIDIYCGDGEPKHYTQENIKSGSDGKHYLLVPTSDMSPGIIRMVITVLIPDNDVPGNVRKEVESLKLGVLKSVI